MSPQIPLDRTDKKLLALLQENAQLSNLELADKVGLSPTPCARRIRKLEEQGIIKRHTAILDEHKLGLQLTALISISMDRHTPDRFDIFETAVKSYPEIIECNLVTGQTADYLLKAILPDMQHYEAFLLGKLTKIEGVTGVQSSFILRKVVEHKALPLAHL